MNDLLLRVSACQAVHPSVLKLVDNVATSVDALTLAWASEFVIEKQCFSNALNLCQIDPSYDLVLGYVYMPDFGIAIEHAWNRSKSGDLDLTAALYWEGEKGQHGYYVELHTYTAEQAIDTYEEHDGIDQSVLRRNPEYKGYWNRHKVAV